MQSFARASARGSLGADNQTTCPEPEPHNMLGDMLGRSNTLQCGAWCAGKAVSNYTDTLLRRLSWLSCLLCEGLHASK